MVLFAVMIMVLLYVDGRVVFVRTHEGRSLFDLVCSAADRCADGIDDNVKRDRGDPIRRSARVNMQCSTHFDFVKWSLGEAPFDIFP